MPLVERPGARIYYEDTGGDGPVVAFSHGILMDHEMFEPQVEALTGRYRCITWDERYHGRSEATGSFTYWDSADDLVGILDDAGVDAAVLAGMSQGGFLSLRAALAHPERVRALFLIDTQAGAEDEGLGELYRSWAATWAEQGPQDHLIQATVPLIVSPAPAEKWTEKWVSWPQANVVPMIDTLLAREDITDRLVEIACPAKVVHGTADPSIPMDKAHELCSGLPACRGVTEIEGGGHASNLSHPDEVNRALVEFLEGLAS
jgi:pimeloyl-ACP methyl ester carboxylesterase